MTQYKFYLTHEGIANASVIDRPEFLYIQTIDCDSSDMALIVNLIQNTYDALKNFSQQKINAQVKKVLN